MKGKVTVIAAQNDMKGDDKTPNIPEWVKTNAKWWSNWWTRHTSITISKGLIQDTVEACDNSDCSAEVGLTN